jgi:hypothetical protein
MPLPNNMNPSEAGSGTGASMKIAAVVQEPFCSSRKVGMELPRKGVRLI